MDSNAIEEVKEVCFLLTLEKSLSLSLSWVGLQVQPLSLSTPAFWTPASFQETSNVESHHHHAPRVESAMRKIEVSSTVCKSIWLITVQPCTNPTANAKENCTTADTCWMLLEIVIIFRDKLRPLKSLQVKVIFGQK